MFDIWRQPSVLAEEQYEKDNYKIVRNETGEGYCAIFCSSNSIWFPNEQEYFEKSIIQKDRYEWMNVHCSLASKSIYVRDIYKSWYVTGINSRINTVDNLVDFLKGETAGYKVITIGSSSGGYLAVLLGILLNADHVIAFSAQFELRNKYAFNPNPFLQKYEGTDRSKYYDLKPFLLKSQVPVYYVVPLNCETDLYHWNRIKDVPNIGCLRFNSKHHGVVMFKANLEKFVSMNCMELDNIFQKWSGKLISPFRFSVHLIGFRKPFMYLISFMGDMFKKKLFRR